MRQGRPRIVPAQLLVNSHCSGEKLIGFLLQAQLLQLGDDLGGQVLIARPNLLTARERGQALFDLPGCQKTGGALPASQGRPGDEASQVITPVQPAQQSQAIALRIVAGSNGIEPVAGVEGDAKDGMVRRPGPGFAHTEQHVGFTAHGLLVAACNQAENEIAPYHLVAQRHPLGLPHELVAFPDSPGPNQRLAAEVQGQRVLSILLPGLIVALHCLLPVLLPSQHVTQPQQTRGGVSFFQAPPGQVLLLANQG